METMERIAVRSRDIAIIGYDATQSILEVVFRRGGVYHYTGVPEEICRAFLNATSQGTYFEREIKNRFPYQKIR